MFGDSMLCGCCASSWDYFSDDIVGGEFNETFCRQRQKSIDNASLRRVAESWSQVPSLEQLVYFISSYQEPMDRMWLVFYWITQNISYGNKFGIDHFNARSVFMVRQGICEGYSSLFQWLSRSVGIPCRKIYGLAKGRGYEKEPFLGRIRWFINCLYPPMHITNHVWNAVRLSDRSWYLVDSTWGSGYNDSMQASSFRRELKTHYFLTRPEQFSYSHLPAHASWQLLIKSERVSYGTFVRRPRIWPAFFDLQLQVVEPANSPELTFDRQHGFAKLLIRAPPEVTISSSLEKNEIKTSDKQCLVQFINERQIWQCLFIPQQYGRHTVTIFGHLQNSSDNGKCAMEFHFDAPLYRPVKRTVFPETYSSFSTFKCELFEPLDGQLKQGSQVTIHCRVINAISVRLIFDDNEWLPEDGYDQTTGHFKKIITVPKSKITLNVKNKAQLNYTTLLLYTIVSKI